MSNASEEFDAHSLELFITYKQLRVSALGLFLARVGEVADDVSAIYGRAHRLAAPDYPSLIIDTADTSNSIKLTLGEGWLPQISTDEEHDIVVSVPKKLGMPLLIGYLVLNGASTMLDMRNDYLDSQIKTIELQLKETELNETLYGEHGAIHEVRELAPQAIEPLLGDEDINSFELRGIDLVAICRREDDDERNLDRER